MSITVQQLHDIIKNNAAAKKLADEGNDSGALAAIKPDLPTEVVEESFFTELSILSAFSNPMDAETCLQKLETTAESNPILKRVLKWIAPGAKGLDFGNASVRAQLDYLHGVGILNDNELSVLKGLGEQKVLVTVDEVSAAWSQYRGAK
jgi:hypothetical protein